jgi:hypothetical protein
MQCNYGEQGTNNSVKVGTANLENHDRPPFITSMFTEVFKNEHDIIQPVGGQRQTHPNVSRHCQ